MIDIGITPVRFRQGKMGDNKFRIFEANIDLLTDYAEQCALEYLVTGMVVPEYQFEKLSKQQLEVLGIKKYTSLSLPTSTWVIDPELITINSPLFGGQPSYFQDVPPEMINFITTGGQYSDGTEDKELFKLLSKMYPELVKAVKAGEEKIPIEDTLGIIRRRPLTGSPYPIPYLYPAIESLRHKRQIRKMDYSIAARAISAILHGKVGNDEYPVTDPDDQQLASLRQNLLWQNTTQDVDRIYYLITNHATELEWVYPPLQALLDENKYISVNQDIINSLGFPKILVTGETDRTQTSDADIALLAPTKTLENMRRQILKIIHLIVVRLAEENGIKEVPEIEFEAMNLVAFADFISAISDLYGAGNLSREEYAKLFGYNVDDELQKRALENEMIADLNIEEFAPVPHSNTPNSGGNGTDEEEVDNNEQESDEDDTIE